MLTEEKVIKAIWETYGLRKSRIAEMIGKMKPSAKVGGFFLRYKFRYFWKRN